jgi:hypothetical protein
MRLTSGNLEWGISMTTHLTGLTVAGLLVLGTILPGYAEDAAAPETPAATQPAAPPPSVPRPSLVPKAEEPAAPVTEAEPPPAPAPRHIRRYARHRWHGYYRTAYWEPFPIYWPHFYHNRIHWNRIPWIINF